MSVSVTSQAAGPDPGFGFGGGAGSQYYGGKVWGGYIPLHGAVISCFLLEGYPLPIEGGVWGGARIFFYYIFGGFLIPYFGAFWGPF